MVFEYLAATYVPVERAQFDTVAGAGIFTVVLELPGVVPDVGGVVQLGVAAVWFGAVLNSDVGLEQFAPVTVPAGTEG